MSVEVIMCNTSVVFLRHGVLSFILAYLIDRILISRNADSCMHTYLKLMFTQSEWLSSSTNIILRQFIVQSFNT